MAGTALGHHAYLSRVELCKTRELTYPTEGQMLGLESHGKAIHQNGENVGVDNSLHYIDLPGFQLYKRGAIS